MGKCGSEFGVRQTWVGTELCHSVEVRLPTGTLWDPRFPFLSAGRGARHGSPEAGMGTAPTPPAGWPGSPRSGPAPNAQHVGRPRPDALRPHPPRPPGGLGGLWRCRLPELLCLLRPEAAWRPCVQAPSAVQWVEGGEAGLGGAGRGGPTGRGPSRVQPPRWGPRDARWRRVGCQPARATLGLQKEEPRSKRLRDRALPR